MLKIGYVGEHNARLPVIDIKEYLEMWPGSTAALLVNRPTEEDEDPYPATLDYGDGTITWIVNTYDTAIEGMGKAQLVFTKVEDGVNVLCGKSEIFQTRIMASLANTESGETPDPYETWVDTIIAQASSAVASAGEAKAWAVGTNDTTAEQHDNSAKDWAEAAADSASDASDSETNAATSEANSETFSLKAEGYAVGKQNGVDVQSGTYFHNNSKYYADQAEDSATAAAGSASDAANSALDANDYADEANAWANGTIGGTDVPSTADQYHNNAYYYRGLAAKAKAEAEIASMKDSSSYLSEDGGVMVIYAQDTTVADSAGTTQTIKDHAKGWAGEAKHEAELAAGSAADAEEAVEHYPYIGQNGNWYVWDAEEEAFVDTGDPSRGADGTDGTDGVSPTVTVSTITGGHRITITDVDHPSGQTVNVMDGETPDVPVESGTGLGAVQTKWFTQYGTDYAQTASGAGAFAEGRGTTASGIAAHAEGTLTTASGSAAHSEGGSTVASGSYSHAQGLGTVAAGAYEHAQGVYNKITAIYPNWTASTSYSIGDKVSRNSSTYECIEANSDATFTSSKWNRIGQGTGDRAFVIGNGNGSSDLVRSNAAAIDWSGDAHFAGNVYVGANADSTGGTMLPRDVQVDGTSVVSNGVAVIPKIGTNTFGVAQVKDTYGIGATQYRYLYIYPANSNETKAGTNAYRPIVPNNQHESTFYGLAKAAGDTTQASSSNAVGTYTDNAKQAIKGMLGIADVDGFRLIKEITITEETGKIIVTTDSNGNAFELSEFVVLFTDFLGSGTSNGAVVVNGEVAGNDAAFVSILNMYNTSTAQKRAAHGCVRGGKFFGSSASAHLGASNYLPVYLSENQASSGVVDCNLITKLTICSLNSHNVTAGTIRIYGRKVDNEYAVGGGTITVNVSGSTPTINGVANRRYVCGECATLDIKAPASGCIDVMFNSGSTPTLLTVSSAKTGVTAVKWMGDIKPNTLEANTTYEVNILDGEYGVIGAWT